ncbi:hypothetical protein EJB05_26561, partial [Eragrostis curvula]
DTRDDDRGSTHLPPPTRVPAAAGRRPCHPAAPIGIGSSRLVHGAGFFSASAAAAVLSVLSSGGLPSSGRASSLVSYSGRTFSGYLDSTCRNESQFVAHILHF